MFLKERNYFLHSKLHSIWTLRRYSCTARFLGRFRAFMSSCVALPPYERVLCTAFVALLRRQRPEPVVLDFSLTFLQTEIMCRRNSFILNNFEKPKPRDALLYIKCNTTFWMNSSHVMFPLMRLSQLVRLSVICYSFLKLLTPRKIRTSSTILTGTFKALRTRSS